jgi:hypothetical protein
MRYLLCVTALQPQLHIDLSGSCGSRCIRSSQGFNAPATAACVLSYGIAAVWRSMDCCCSLTCVMLVLRMMRSRRPAVAATPTAAAAAAEALSRVCRYQDVALPAAVTAVQLGTHCLQLLDRLNNSKQILPYV